MYMHTYVCVCMYVCVYIYIYINNWDDTDNVSMAPVQE